jgi:hypothetical protein
MSSKTRASVTNIIPITEDKNIELYSEHYDATFIAKPIVGKTEIEIFGLADKFRGSDDFNRALIEAEREVKATSGGKRWKKGEQEEAIRDLAAKKCPSGMSLTPEEIETLYKTLDNVIIGWKEKEGWPPKPKGRHIYDCFHMPVLIEIFNLLIENSGLSEGDVKN